MEKSRSALHQAKDKFGRLYSKARKFLGLFDYIRFSWLLSECERKQRLSLDVKYNDSIRRFRQERYGFVTNDYDTIINLPEVELSILQKEALCRGVDFAVPGKISEP